jgi:hypothetical protein
MKESAFVWDTQHGAVILGGGQAFDNLSAGRLA